MDHIAKNKARFQNFEPNIDSWIPNNSLDHTWGGNLEIVALSEFYNMGIRVYELNQFGNLKTSFDNLEAAEKFDLPSIWISRHRKSHYNNILRADQKLPLFDDQDFPIGTDMLDFHVSERRNLKWKPKKKLKRAQETAPEVGRVKKPRIPQPLVDNKKNPLTTAFPIQKPLSLKSCKGKPRKPPILLKGMLRS